MLLRLQGAAAVIIVVAVLPLSSPSSHCCYCSPRPPSLRLRLLPLSSLCTPLHSHSRAVVVVHVIALAWHRRRCRARRCACMAWPPLSLSCTQVRLHGTDTAVVVVHIGALAWHGCRGCFHARWWSCIARLPSLLFTWDWLSWLSHGKKISRSKKKRGAPRCASLWPRCCSQSTVAIALLLQSGSSVTQTCDFSGLGPVGPNIEFLPWG